MPQFDVSTYLTQIFWLITTFFAFWFVMDKFIVPQIRDCIEDRKRKYDDIILKAEKINRKAMASLKKYEEAIAAAKISATEKIKQNENELKEILAQKEKDVLQRLDEKIKESEEYLNTELEKTKAKVDKLAEETAFSVLQKLGIDNISIEDVEKASNNRG
ncbi:MAG: hypothetical protein IKW39_03530 [Alphaproteobacteria bacterium]|nr:hypothetical protein [Alphaproteobacteria bacterium]